MGLTSHEMTRRTALTTAGIGIAATVGTHNVAQASEWTAVEKANVQVVNDFCSAWASHDVGKIMSFFADTCTYRLNERHEPTKGRQAVTDLIQRILDHVQRYEVIETFAKGPMVFNERVDRFTNGRSWHGVGVFFLVDGKIVEWYDYTISTDRA